MMRSWLDLQFWNSDVWHEIQGRLDEWDRQKVVYFPARKDIFNALKQTPFSNVRCVILGQDPYHDGSAEGLAFSSSDDIHKVPPTLRNIMLEYEQDLALAAPRTGSLSPWTKSGVLLLNSVLTVQPGRPLSHVNVGWQQLTNEILFEVSHSNENTVFVIWGKQALNQAESQIGKAPRVISNHPSPLAANKPPIPFIGSRPFTKVNALLSATKERPIQWRLS